MTALVCRVCPNDPGLSTTSKSANVACTTRLLGRAGRSLAERCHHGCAVRGDLLATTLVSSSPALTDAERDLLSAATEVSCSWYAMKHTCTHSTTLSAAFLRVQSFSCCSKQLSEQMLRLLRYAEELRLRETEERLEEGELGSPSCATLDATAVRARR